MHDTYVRILHFFDTLPVPNAEALISLVTTKKLADFVGCHYHLVCRMYNFSTVEVKVFTIPLAIIVNPRLFYLFINLLLVVM